MAGGGQGGGRGGQGGGRGGRGGGQGEGERRCAYRRRNSPPAASTPLRAGSASSMKNKMRALGSERREKGIRLIQHASRSADC